MKFIDLRKEYPHLDSTYSEYPVSYKIDAVFEEYRLAEQALEKRRTRNGDVVSLDSDPGIEAHIADHQPGPVNTPPETVPLDRTNGALGPLKWCIATAAMVH